MTKKTKIILAIVIGSIALLSIAGYFIGKGINDLINSTKIEYIEEEFDLDFPDNMELRSFNIHTVNGRSYDYRFYWLEDASDMDAFFDEVSTPSLSSFQTKMNEIIDVMDIENQLKPNYTQTFDYYRLTITEGNKTKTILVYVNYTNDYLIIAIERI